MKFIDAYFDSIGKSQLDALDSDIVAELVMQFVEENGQWTGTATQLHELLQMKVQQSKGFPKSPKALTSKLNILRVDLEAVGIAWIDLKDNKHRKQLKKISSDTLIPANSAQSAHSAQSLENTGSKPVRNDKNDSAQGDHDSALPHDPAHDSAPKKPLKKADGAESAASAESEGSKNGGEKKLENLREEILRIIDIEAPKTKFHSMRPKAIFDLLSFKFPEATISDVFKVCEQAYKEGILIKNSVGAYSYNVDGGS